MTLLQIVNKVLIRLREAQVAATADSEYATLIGEFVNETKREVEDAHNWTALRRPLIVTTTAAIASYQIPDSGHRFLILDVLEAGVPSRLQKQDSTSFRPQHVADTASGKTGYPTTYNIENQFGGNAFVTFLPIPDAVYQINFYCKIPQDDAVDGTEIIMDQWPIILGTYAKALAERGEDAGTSVDPMNQKYNLATADAIALDLQKVVGEDTWHV